LALNEKNIRLIPIDGSDISMQYKKG